MEKLRERDWRRLVETIHRGNCVLVLGSDVACDPHDAELRPLTSRLTELLAIKSKLDPSIAYRCELPLVAQLYLQQPRVDRIDLELEVSDFYQPFLEQTTEFHRQLAQLPFSLCVTTTPDRFMLNALREVKQPQHAFYDFSDAGRHTLLTGAAPERPIVYSLFGDLEKTASLVLSETELLDFLVMVARGNSGLPDFIRAELARQQTAFLFVGFGFQRWYARILLHVIQTESRREARSLAVEGDAFFRHPDHERAVLLFEETRSITFCQQGWIEFANELRAAYERQYPPDQRIAEPSKGSPKVFLCHDSRDYEAVATLEHGLHELGVDTWRDRQDLRGGDAWGRRIPQVICKQVNYVLVCLTPNLVTKGESYLHLEIKEALERQKRHPEGWKFLIPIKLQPCEVLQELEHLHCEDLTDEDGLQHLVETLLEDWSQRSFEDEDESE